MQDLWRPAPCVCQCGSDVRVLCCVAGCRGRCVLERDAAESSSGCGFTEIPVKTQREKCAATTTVCAKNAENRERAWGSRHPGVPAREPTFRVSRADRHPRGNDPAPLESPSRVCASAVSPLRSHQPLRLSPGARPLRPRADGANRTKRDARPRHSPTPSGTPPAPTGISTTRDNRRARARPTARLRATTSSLYTRLPSHELQ